MRTVLGILTLAAALAAAPVLTAPAGAAPMAPAAAPGDLHPGALPRGDDPKVPYVVGTTVVDGDTRIRIDGDYAALLGRSGEALVVETDGKVLRVTAEDQERVARLRNGAEALLSEDGEHLVVSRIGRHGRTNVRVLDATTGDRLAARKFTKYAVALAAAGDRVVLSASAPARTFWWDHDSGTVRRIVGRIGSVADIGANRLSTLTGDPYQGGCSVVTTLRRPIQRLWRSCREAAMSFAPDGGRMATTHILADGLGPGKVWLRRTDGGRLLASYSAYWFGTVQWETNRALLLDTHTKKRWATLRCVRHDCERASKIRKERLS